MKLASWVSLIIAIFFIAAMLFPQDEELLTSRGKSFQDVLSSTPVPWASGGHGGSLDIWYSESGFQCDDKLSGRFEFFIPYFKEAETLTEAYLPQSFSFYTVSIGAFYHSIFCDEVYQSALYFAHWMCTDFENRKDNPRQILLSQLASCLKEPSISCQKTIEFQMTTAAFKRQPEWLKIIIAAYGAQHDSKPTAMDVFDGIVTNDKATMGDRCVAARHWLNIDDSKSASKQKVEIANFLDKHCAKCSGPLDQ